MLSLSQALKRWSREPVIGTTADEIETMRFYSRQAQEILMEINTQYHEPEVLRQLFSRLIGRPVDEVIKTIKGIKCGVKPTSCPDQLALALEQAVAEEAK